MDASLLPLIWAVFLASAVTLYVVLDGFSLGIGILFPFARDTTERDAMMRSVVPVWDGNQTWLVGGGAALFTAFPMAFNLLLTALYLPLMVMVLALVLRGSAFEFRFKAANKRPWDWAFSGGCFIAAFCQGLILGVHVQGYVELFDSQALSVRHLFTPFSIFTAFAVPAAYALLGACWLRIKTSGHLQQWAVTVARRLVPVAGLSIAIVCLWTPMLVPAIAERWFAMPNLLLLSPIPVWTLGLLIALYWSLKTPSAWEPQSFLLAVGVFLLTLIGLGISLWPYVVPRGITIWEAAAPPETLEFVLVGVLLVVPVIFLYTAHSYYVFRGKVDTSAGY